MRKFSKLLAVLLTLCLLFGAITAIVASADGEAANTLKITDYSFNYEDFGDTKAFESENSSRGFGIKSALSEADNNSYVRIFCDTADMSDTNDKAPGYRANQGRIMYTLGLKNYKETIPEGATHSDRDLKNFDYLTIDFDLGSDRYAYSYTKDGATAYVTAKDDAEFKTLTGLDFNADTMTKGLAFLDNDHFGFLFNIHSSLTDDAISYNNPTSGSSSKYWDHNETALFKIFKSGDDWYIGVKGDLSSAAKLKGEVGAFDHIQVIFKIDETTTELTLTPYLFVNGEYAATLSAWSSTGKYNIFAWMLFDTNGKGASGAITEKNYDKYSVAFDNFAVNYYNETNDPETASIKGSIANLSSRYSETHDFSEENESVTTKNDKGELEYSTMNKKTGIGLANTAMSRYMLVTHKTLNGNTYARVHYNSEALSNPTGVDGSSDQKNRGGVIGLRVPTTAYSAKVELSNYQYMTFDFDFCADQYRYKYNDVWYTEENLPAEAIAVKDTLTKELAMGDSGSMGFHPFLNAAASLSALSDGSANKVEVSDLEVHFKAVSGVWYAYLGDESNMVALSNEAGIFDHFTYALEYLGENSFKATFYVNGQYAGDKTTNRVSFTGNHASPTLVGKQMAFFMMYFTTHTNSNNTSLICNKMYDKYSLAFDNMAVNYYAKDALPDTSLDETLADKTLPLYNPDAKDVVYNEKYVTPNTDRYVEFKGVKYYVINAGFSKMSNNNVIYAYNVGDGYKVPASFALDKFTVIVAEGTFSFEEEVEAQFKITPTPDGNGKVYERLRSYVKLNDVEVSLEAALAALKDGDKLELAGTNVTGFNKELANFTVICDERSTFEFAADFPAWRYAQVGDTYKRVIDGDIMASVELSSSQTCFNIYVPISEGVKYTKVSYSSLDGPAKDTNVKDGGTMVINGVTYQMIFWSGRMDMFTKTAYAEFTYTEGETTDTLTRFKANFDLLAYVKEVLTYDNYKACGSEVAQLMKAIVDYRVEYMKATAKVDTKNNKSAQYLAEAATDLAEIEAIYTAHENCTCGEYKKEDDYINVGTKNENLKLPQGVSFSIGLGGSNRAFYLIVNVDTTVEALANANCIAVTYTNVYGSEITAYAKINGGHATLPGFTAADFDNTLTLSIGVATYIDESTVDTFTGVENYTFDYSIYDLEAADYSATYAGLDKAAVEALLKAIKNYAIAAENYKKYVPAEA